MAFKKGWKLDYNLKQKFGPKLEKTKRQNHRAKLLRILVSGGVVGVQYAKYDLVCDFPYLCRKLW